jgi:hypothetical protein
VSLFSVFAPNNHIRMQKRALFLLLSVWMLLSIASLAAMYRLWWMRERVLYLGQPAAVQREIVCSRAGLPIETLELAARIEATWPLNMRYSASGSEVTLSYLKYLILPRIPAGSADFEIREESGAYSIIGLAPAAGHEASFSTNAPTPLGLIISMLILFAMAAGLFRLGLNLPEGVAVAALALGVFSVVWKATGAGYAPVGWLMCLFGSIGLLVFGRHRSAWRSALADVVKITEPRWILYVSAGHSRRSFIVEPADGSCCCSGRLGRMGTVGT